MKWAKHCAEWLFHTASSRRNIDRVAMWLGGTVSILAAALAVTVIVIAAQMRYAGNDMSIDEFPDTPLRQGSSTTDALPLRRATIGRH